jgi:hypothetical protein
MSAASLLAVEKVSLSGLTASTTYYARAYAIKQRRNSLQRTNIF